jgi:signal transduction histidine kinase/CheY-like chemotaxis protein
VLLCCCLPTAALGARAIRIGYVDMNGFLYTDADGNHSGYMYDLLMECAQNTGRSYSFVKVRIDECAAMLEQRQIDLVIGVTASVSSREQLIFGKECFLNAPLALVVPPDSPLGYDDYSHLDGKTIGMYETGYSDLLIGMLLSGKGIKAELRSDYACREDLLTDLHNGVLDAAILNTDIGISGLRIIDRLGSRNLLSAALAGWDRTLLDELDAALRELRVSMPGLMEEIVGRYQMVDDDMYPALTRDELTYIRRGRAVKVAIAKEDLLENGIAKKPVQQVLNEISQKTGLTFTYVARDTQDAALEAVRAGKADMMLGFDHDYAWAQQRGVRQSAVYLESSYRALRRPEVTEIRTVAAEEGSYIAFRLKKEKRYQVLLFPSAEACIHAVMDGKADAALCWTPDAEQVLYELGDHGLLYTDNSNYGGSVGIAVSKMSSYRLLPVLNKTISSIRPQRFRTIALPSVSDVHSEKQQVQTRHLTFALVATVLVAAGLIIALSIWVSGKVRSASQYVRSRADYLRVISEEIRRPSQTVLGVAAGGARLTRADTVQALRFAGEDLGELAGEIDVMNQLADRTFQLEQAPVRPEDLFRRLTDFFSQQAEARGILLEVKAPTEECPVILLDEERYRRICLNLMDNALRRTEAGGSIQLSFELEPDRLQKNRMVLVTAIGDNGAMLNNKFVKRISEETTHDTERTLGLRLMTAKRIVKAMGGEMSVHQRPNAGMRLRVQVLVERAEPLEIMSLNRGAYGGKGLLAGRNILLAEENPITAQLLYSLLANEGAHVELVEDGKQLLDMFANSAPAYYHAILTDIELPGMSGLEAAAAIRELPRRDGCSVLIVGMRSGAAAAQPEAGRIMSLILPKPVNTGNLCRKLHTWLGEQQNG